MVTTPFSFVSSANCLLYEEVTPVFCDIDPLTLNLDPDAARAAVTERTAGLLPVHIFGYPAAMEELERARRRPWSRGARGRGGGRRRRRRDGRQGRARGATSRSSPSTRTSSWSTGEGGIAIPSDASVAERMRSERNQGRARDMGWLGHERLGFNYRLTDLQAAMGVAQVERADELIAARDRVAALYAERARGAGGGPGRRGGSRRPGPRLPGPGGRPAELVRLRRSSCRSAPTGTP